jgi:CheY-like chemotaxis protein
VQVRIEPARVESPQSGATGSDELLPGDYVQLSLSCNGKVPSPDDMERIFEPDLGTTAPDPGTGLEMHVAREIVRSHGGVVLVDAREGVGTTFRIYFPAVAAAAAVDQEPPSPQETRRQRHIICVDDDEVIVYITTRALERLGYRATGFLSATAALETFRSTPGEFDAIITDLNMPGMTGPELALEVRQVRPEMPLLLTSGCIRAEDIQTAQKLGLTDLVAKPCRRGSRRRERVTLLAWQTPTLCDPCYLCGDITSESGGENVTGNNDSSTALGGCH